MKYLVETFDDRAFNFQMVFNGNIVYSIFLLAIFRTHCPTIIVKCFLNDKPTIFNLKSEIFLNYS